MTKVIEVRLFQVSCGRNGFGGSIELAGNIFGATFQNNPEDPNDETSRQVIFPFPAGPIGLSQGQTAPVRMDQSVVFVISFDDDGPHFLKIGGELNNGLGSNFFTVDSRTEIPGCLVEPGPKEFDLTFSSPNLQITLGFSLCVQTGF